MVWKTSETQYSFQGLVPMYAMCEIASVYDLQGWDRKAMAHILAVLSGGYNAHFS